MNEAGWWASFRRCSKPWCHFLNLLHNLSSVYSKKISNKRSKVTDLQHILQILLSSLCAFSLSVHVQKVSSNSAGENCCFKQTNAYSSPETNKMTFKSNILTWSSPCIPDDDCWGCCLHQSLWKGMRRSHDYHTILLCAFVPHAWFTFIRLVFLLSAQHLRSQIVVRSRLSTKGASIYDEFMLVN